MRKAENIVAIMISELVVDGMRDKTYQKTFDLMRYEYTVIREVEEILKLFLKYAPIIVVCGWENNNTLGGLYTIKITWEGDLYES